MRDETLTPDLLLHAYRQGIFPMAERRGDEEVFWVDPLRRGVLPPERFHISRSLARTIRRGHFEVTLNRAFGEVMEGCADREETWINDTITGLCHALHRAGRAHSIEVWDGDALVGGVYGLADGGAFFAESMFSRETDASKVALTYLVDRLRQGGFSLLDVQFLTAHLASLGAVEIPRAEYHRRLAVALSEVAEMPSGPLPDPHTVLQRMTQTS